MKSLLTGVKRFLLGLRRPSKRTNLRLMKERGETRESFLIREASEHDLSALVHLHVVTWNDTYPGVKKPPTHQIRENQWRKNFELKEKNWFCYVVQDQKGELVGFATGNTYEEGDLPYAGQLNKIYLLSSHQRLGLGRRLMERVAQRFLDMGIKSMLLFAEAENPSIKFYDALGGERLYTKNGEFHGGYGWSDLRKLEK